MTSIQISSVASDVLAKEDELFCRLRLLGSVVVAYSGGVDSTYLAEVAHDALGARALIVTAQSPSMAENEFAFASEVAAERGWNFRAVQTAEADDPRWLANDSNRCFYCKSELFTVLGDLARLQGIDHILYGAIPEDASDDRPGQRAAAERRVLAPLVDVGLTKPMIRELSYARGLRSWDKPQAACLASRFPTGRVITQPELRQVDRAEAVLAGMGFAGHRVRHHGELARIELLADDWQRLSSAGLRMRIVECLTELGYHHVTIDLAGYKPAGLNR